MTKGCSVNIINLLSILSLTLLPSAAFFSIQKNERFGASHSWSGASGTFVLKISPSMILTRKVSSVAGFGGLWEAAERRSACTSCLGDDVREGLTGINRLGKIKRRRWKVERTLARVYVNVTLAGQVICETNCYQACLSLYVSDTTNIIGKGVSMFITIPLSSRKTSNIYSVCVTISDIFYYLFWISHRT